jgi:hypothetical protein
MWKKFENDCNQGQEQGQPGKVTTDELHGGHLPLGWRF